MIYIGTHSSSSRGYTDMAEQAHRIGADTFAFFTRNPRGGNAKKISEQDIKTFLTLSEKYHFGAFVAHAPYTMNPCAAKPELREFAQNMMIDDLNRLEYTPGNYYNFHPGSHVGQGIETGIAYTAAMLNTALSPEQSTIVLVETMAGKGTEIGRTFEEIREILDRVKLSDKIGVCLDTCHIWDGGYDIVHNLDAVIQKFDSIIGLNRLKAVHLNDSMNELNSHKDRHQKIGQGCIGSDALKRVVNHPAFQGLPFILETPNDEEGWAKEIAMIRSWFE